MKEGREFILSYSFSKSFLSVEIAPDGSKCNRGFSPNGPVLCVECLAVLCIPLQGVMPGTQWGHNDFFKLSTFSLAEAGLKE